MRAIAVGFLLFLQIIPAPAQISPGGRAILAVTPLADGGPAMNEAVGSARHIMSWCLKNNVRVTALPGRRIQIDAPTVSELGAVQNCIGKDVSLTFHLAADDIPPARRSEAEIMLLPQLNEKVRLPVYKKVLLSGDHIVDASNGIGDPMGNHVVNVKLDSAGRATFARITEENVNHRLAIVLDGKVLTAPFILSPIRGGQLQISASGLTQKLAFDLAIQLRASALPVVFRLVSLTAIPKAR
jgi:preprotein translocase subunit SecD